MAFVDFDDPGVPLGKRKQAFVKWLMQRHGHTLSEARIAAHRKFGYSNDALIQRRDAATAVKWQQLQERNHRRWGRSDG